MPRSRKKQRRQSPPPAEETSRLPDLPALIWAERVAPYLSRNDCNSIMLCRKDIREAVKNHQSLFWPTTQLVLKNIRMEYCRTAFSHDSQWLVVIPLPISPRRRWICVWNMHHGPLLPFNQLKLPVKEFDAEPESIFFSRDCKYLVIKWTTCLEDGFPQCEFGVYDVVADSESASFEISNYRELILDPHAHYNVRYYQITADGQSLITRYAQEIDRNSWIEFIAIWDLRSGACVRRVDETFLGAYQHNIICTQKFILETTAFRIRYNEDDGTASHFRQGSISIDFPFSESSFLEHVSVCPSDSTLLAVLRHDRKQQEKQFLELFRLEKHGSDVSLNRAEFGVIARSSSRLRLNDGFQWSSDGKHIIMFNRAVWASRSVRPQRKKFFAFPVDPSNASLQSHAGSLVEKANQAIDQYLNPDDIAGFNLSSDGHALVIWSGHHYEHQSSQRPFIVSL